MGWLEMVSTEERPFSHSLSILFFLAAPHVAGSADVAVHGLAERGEGDAKKGREMEK